MWKMKRNFIGILVLVAVMILSACGNSEESSDESKEKIKIGFILSDSGTFAPLSG